MDADVATAADVLVGLEWSEPDESGSVQPMSHLAAHRRFQLIAQRAAAQEYVRSEQTFDGGEGTGRVAVVQTGANVHKTFRVPVCLVDRLQARQCGTAQRDQQLFAANLVGVVVQWDEHPVHHADSVRGATTLDGARIP